MNIFSFLNGALILCAILLLTSCSSQRPSPATSSQSITRHEIPVLLQSTPHRQNAGCAEKFVTHQLHFSTGTRVRQITTYLSNGAGVAVNDLDQDGDLDLVFASVDGQSEILWNEGGLNFRSQPLAESFTRAVAIVDVDGDGWQDITFTHRGFEPISWWRNEGGGGGKRGREEDKKTRRQEDKKTVDGGTVNPSQPLTLQSPVSSLHSRNSLSGVDNYAYAMGWADMNGDGTLDLVTGSYGAELKQNGIEEPEKDVKAGIFLHLQNDGKFSTQRLDARSEALSIALTDLNQDQQPDIWVANDFNLQDLLWFRNPTGWQLEKPFPQTSHSTMSIDWGDLNNRGSAAFFTTDMNPYDISPQVLAEWLPMMAKMGDAREAGDPQLMANVLLERNRQGDWQNRARFGNVDASGWSWAGKFGDLDQDGWLDLYVVNGMIAHDMFAHLENDELVEENQAYHNQGNGSFARDPQWNLGSTASGRGMVMADMDNDGDLDIIVNNLRGWAELHENQLCTGQAITVDLRWEDSSNPFALGAQVILQTSLGRLWRDVHASGGYLSGDASRLHFGLPAEASIQQMEIIWPDGSYSIVPDVNHATHLQIVR